MFGLTTTRRLRAAQVRISDLQSLLDAERAAFNKDVQAYVSAIIKKDCALAVALKEKMDAFEELRLLKAAARSRRDQEDRHNAARDDTRRRLQADVDYATRRIQELERALQLARREKSG
jgi:hypothetical protein